MSADNDAVSLSQEQAMLWVAACLLRLTPFVKAAGMLEELDAIEDGTALLSGGVIANYAAKASSLDQQIRSLMGHEENESYRGVEYVVLDVLVLLGIGLRLGGTTDQAAVDQLTGQLGEQARAIWETIDQLARRGSAEIFQTVHVNGGQFTQHALLSGIENSPIVQFGDVGIGGFEQSELEAQARMHQLLGHTSASTVRNDPNLLAPSEDTRSIFDLLVSRYRDADTR